MPSEPDHTSACACSTGLQPPNQPLSGPVGTENPPGRDTLRFRIGTHGSFKESMIQAAARREALRNHASRSDSSAITAFMDMAALLLDNLTFYQERWANEGYLPTARERLSLLELARSIGYELSPGVAASTHLAFEVQTAPGMPETVEIPKGVLVQDIPLPGGQPQFFETVDSLAGLPAWNRFAPKATRPQQWTTGKEDITVAGTGLNLPLGARLLVLYGPLAAGHWTTATIREVEEDFPRGTTRFLLSQPLNGPSGTQPAGYPRVYAFATQARAFGSNAPDWRSLPTSSKLAYLGLPETGSVPPANAYEWPNFVIHLPREFPSRFDLLHQYVERDTGSVMPLLRIMEESGGGGGTSGPEFIVEAGPAPAPAFNQFRSSTLSLDAEYKEILEGSLVLLDDPAGLAVLSVLGVELVSRSAFAVSGKSTVLTVEATELSPFREAVRSLTVLAGSRELELAEETDPGPVAGSRLRLDPGIPGLPAGRILSIEGLNTESGQPEAAIVSVRSMEPNPEEPGWILELNEALDWELQRSTVVLRGNILPATHGQTHVELPGHGDARRRWVKMPLKQAPLTYLSSDSHPRGVESTLRVEVDGIAWTAVDTFYRTGSEDEVFTVRHLDSGEAFIQFGDGRTGRRLPTGANNIKATYRSGIGAPGNMAAGRLTNLMSRPLGLTGVAHPVPASGGEDPESREDARLNAPLTVKTLDRLVSLRDYADFARSFAGISKAGSVWGRFGPDQGILLTVAGADGAYVAEDSRLGKSFREALERYRDPGVPVEVLNFQPLLFRFSGTVYHDQRHDPEKVSEGLIQVLSARFTFPGMRLGEAVTASGLLALLQGVDGVVGVDLDTLHRADRAAERQTRIPAGAGRVDQAGVAHPAELLTLDPDMLDRLGDHLALGAVDAASGTET